MTRFNPIFMVAIIFYRIYCVHCGGGGTLDLQAADLSLLSNLAEETNCVKATINRHSILPGARYKKRISVTDKLKLTGNTSIRTIAIIGKVDTVLRGAEGIQKEWEVRKLGIAGIGAATFNKWNAVGEAVFVNNLAVIRPSDNATSDYYKTTTSDKFRTQFSAFVTHEARPAGEFTVSFPTDEKNVKTPMAHFPINGSMFISEFYSRIYTAVGKHPYCYAGIAVFDTLEAIALSLAPVYSEPLFGENKKKYYGKPVEKLPGSTSMIIGCAANYLDLEDNPELEAKMKMLLYKNPFDTGRPQAEFHGHAITLKRCVTTIGHIRPDDIGEAFHMVNTAKIKVARVQVYVLKDASQLVSLDED